jgi:segregation and condensation protein A
MSVAFAEDDKKAPVIDGEFLLDLDGFDGPIDLLLQLARDKKIDLTKLSITALADQYLCFIERARHLRLEITADYLVMAAWLAYLKSRLLLPSNDNSTEPSAEEMAAALAFQLKRLEAMRIHGQLLLERPRLGSAILAKGAPETFTPTGIAPIALTLHQLLQAYGSTRKKAIKQTHYEIAPLAYHSIEMALERMANLIGHIPDWAVLSAFLPDTGNDDPLFVKSTVASTFGASLELVKRGVLTLRQDEAFSPIYIKRAEAQSSHDH